MNGNKNKCHKWMVCFLLPFFFGMHAFSGWGQKVGLVMSGGGAKGLAHIGVLKALEENEIPIDYIVGTSMGGIVGGCYAAGMSPEEIEELACSDKFLRWTQGKFEKIYDYYYYDEASSGTFLQVDFMLDSGINLNWSSSVVNDHPINFALTEKLAQPSAVAHNNFDSLFVPLRLMAADLLTQSSIVLKDGLLSDAVRATMAVPIIFPPTKIKGKYLFDGGIYNNFPVDVVENEFHPDIIIGSVVSMSADPLQDTSNVEYYVLNKAIQYLLINQRGVKKFPEQKGVVIHPSVDEYSAMNFSKVRALIDSGYIDALRKMPELKKKIKRRKSIQQLTQRRRWFTGRSQPLLVKKIEFDGFDPLQKRFLTHFFYRKRDYPITSKQVKESYARLVSGGYLNLYPSFQYFRDQQEQGFSFTLSRRPMGDFMVNIGGVLATRNISAINLHLNHYFFNRALFQIQGDLTTGSFYKSVGAKIKMNIASLKHIYIQPHIRINNWDFLRNNNFIFRKEQISPAIRTDRIIQLDVGIPLSDQYKVTLQTGWISNTDYYFNTPEISSSYTFDHLSLKGIHFGVHLSTDQLDYPQYATKGYAVRLAADAFRMTEKLTPGNTSVWTLVDPHQHTWVRASCKLEQYVKKGGYSVGYLAEASLSNQPPFINYYGTLINSPGFFPLQDSRMYILENFRSFSYLAGGLRQVLALRRALDFRLEAYAFAPFQTITEGEQQAAVSSINRSPRIVLAATSGFVFRSSVGPVSASVNYYDSSKKRWGVLLHVGFLLFNKTSLE